MIHTMIIMDLLLHYLSLTDGNHSGTCKTQCFENECAMHAMEACTMSKVLDDVPIDTFLKEIE